MRALSLCALFAVGLVVTGCGEKPKSRVHGKITYQGKALNDLTVIFLASDNTTYPVNIQGDGSYEVSGVTRGTIQVSIQQALPSVPARADPDPTGKLAAAKGAAVGDEKGAARPSPPPSTPRERKVNLPTKYADPTQSGLSFELKEPDQEWSIDLK